MDELPKIARETMASAIPAVFGSLVCFTQETINLVFIGRLKSSEALAAVGMGNMLINLFGCSIYFGINGAIDTLVS